jgi:hypothetical protein
MDMLHAPERERRFVIRWTYLELEAYFDYLEVQRHV